MQQNRLEIKRLVLAAMMLALALLLPNITGNIPEIGKMLLPMHVPALLAGFICGGWWGAGVGAMAPLLRSMLMGGHPPMFPTAVAMALEMAVYGFAAGVLYRRFPRNLGGIYASLLSAMVLGRVVWGAAMMILVGGSGDFTFTAFLTGAVIKAIFGIVLQLVAVPPIVYALKRANLIPGELKERE